VALAPPGQLNQRKAFVHTTGHTAFRTTRPARSQADTQGEAGNPFWVGLRKQ
jgi:hypothetical protein